tara:strand:- start:2734 stop:3765 length:1032 start_codon:yes stop_codon:yes gene_type:complete
MRGFENTDGLSGTCIIAEVGLAHEGSLGQAIAYIDSLAAIGVDAVKFQCHLAEYESSKEEKFRVNVFPQDHKRQDYWSRTSFNVDEWKILSDRCKEKGIIFACTPFSLEALDLLIQVNVDLVKIGSGEAVSSPNLIQKAFQTELPTLVSSGMSNFSEISSLVSDIKTKNHKAGIMQCTSSYPTPLEKVGLNILDDLKNSGVLCGLSDHSGKMSPSLYCIANGFNFLEVHVCFDKRMFGPDTTSSLTLSMIEELVLFRDELETMQANIIDKDLVADQMDEMRTLFGRSLALRKDYKKNEVLLAEDLILKKPGNGADYSMLPSLVGRRVKRDLPSDHFILDEDLE